MNGEDGDGGGVASGFSNFKGVMLCNRPTQILGSSQASYGVKQVDNPLLLRPPFSATVTHDVPLGLAPVKKDFEVRTERRQKGADVTWRHKKWLGDFQNRRSVLMDMIAKKADKMERMKATFTDKCAKQREMVRLGGYEEAFGIQNGNRQSQPDNNDDVEQSSTKDDGEVPISATEVALDDGPKNRWIRRKKEKPAWALTHAEQVAEEDKEMESLLKFANELDYDKVVQDIEVKEALRFVKERVSKLEEQRKEEAEMQEALAKDDYGDQNEYEWVEVDGNNNETGQIIDYDPTRRNGKSKGTVAHENGWNSSTKTDDKGKNTSNMEMAKNIKDSMGKVHSIQSVQKMIENVERNSVSAYSVPGSNVTDAHVIRTVPENGVQQTPKVIVHDHTAKEGKSGDLPFLYRNPAI